ncbi:MAG: NRDE family protein [Gammaproteobacteria bacterium]
MCLLVFAWQQHPRYRFIVAGNRDEFHDRPTAPAHWWKDHPNILAGQDLRAGGSWLGVSRSGRFGIVTNFRETAAPGGGLRSRGELISAFLNADEKPVAWLADRQKEQDTFGGFNLIVGDVNELGYMSNRGQEATSLPGGIAGLSNRSLDTPWPKLLRARGRFEGVIGDASPNPDSLFDMLADREQSQDDTLPDTGIPREWERLLSSIFIVSPAYGTRASTVLLIGHDGHIFFEERRFGAEGQLEGASQVEFDVETG